MMDGNIHTHIASMEFDLPRDPVVIVAPSFERRRARMRVAFFLATSALTVAVVLPVTMIEAHKASRAMQEAAAPVITMRIDEVMYPAAETAPAVEPVVPPAFAAEPVETSMPAQGVSAESAVGVYLTPSSVSRDDFFTDTVEETQKSGGNALVFDVKGSAVFFDADAPMAKELGLIKTAYDLAEVIDAAHERGMYVIGRFIAVKDAGFTRARPDTMIRHPQSKAVIGYEFIDPENPDALEYNRQVLCALAKTGIDEVNLDYIRFSTEQFGALHAYSTEEKSRKVGAFVRMARSAIDECGPATKLGLSTYAILGWNYEKNLATLGQDVVTFAPYVDVISPMAYPATFSQNAYYNPGVDRGSRMYHLVWRTLEGYKELIGEENAHKLRPWIQGYGVTLKNMKDQMQAVTDAGLCGFTVWNADNAYGVSYKAIPSFVPAAGCAGTPTVVTSRASS